MVGLGALFILVFAIILFVLYRKDISRPRLLQIVGVALIPLAYIASECGWFGSRIWASALDNTGYVAYMGSC